MECLKKNVVSFFCDIRTVRNSFSGCLCLYVIWSETIKPGNRTIVRLRFPRNFFLLNFFKQYFLDYITRRKERTWSNSIHSAFSLISSVVSIFTAWSSSITSSVVGFCTSGFFTSVVDAGESRGHLHRSSTGTSFNACSICFPQPFHVGFSHWSQSIFIHIFLLNEWIECSYLI